MRKDIPRIVFIAVFIVILLSAGVYIAFKTEPIFRDRNVFVNDENKEKNALSDDGETSTDAESPERDFGAFVNQILNGEYEIKPEESYKFHNGAYYFKYGPCKGNCQPLSNYPDSNYAVAIDKDNIAIGDLNGDNEDDAAILLGERYGGTGYFVSLAIFRNDGGVPVFVALKDLGDRTVVKSIEINDGLITLKLLTHDGGEPMCCPNTPTTVVFEFMEGTLLEKSEN